MEIKILSKGPEKAIVEAGSQAESDMKAMGFSEGKDSENKTKPSPKKKSGKD